MPALRCLGSRFLRVWVFVAIPVALPSLVPVLAADTYVRATVEKDGQLRIVTAAGQTIEPTQGKGQVGFAKPQIAPDGSAVGWLAEYPNCCTSYPLPLQLMILTNGTVRTFTGNGLPVWRWAFQAGGTQFALQQETVHGGWSVHYELHDVVTGRMLAEYNPEVGADNQPLVSQHVPDWVRELGVSWTGQ